MTLHLSFFTALCETREFEINGIKADHEDFGEKYDHDEDSAEPYGCGCMEFDPKPATPWVLEKYGITPQEYDEVCRELRKGLSFGSCGWCI